MKSGGYLYNHIQTIYKFNFIFFNYNSYNCIFLTISIARISNKILPSIEDSDYSYVAPAQIIFVFPLGEMLVLIWKTWAFWYQIYFTTMNSPSILHFETIFPQYTPLKWGRFPPITKYSFTFLSFVYKALLVLSLVFPARLIYVFEIHFCVSYQMCNFQKKKKKNELVNWDIKSSFWIITITFLSY